MTRIPGWASGLLAEDSGTISPQARSAGDDALRPKARWLVTSLHRALPGVRVQAWLGDVTGGGHMDLESAATRSMGRLLSVAAEPVAGLGLAQPWSPDPHWWPPGYLHQVAIRSDEVAIMTYNTPLPAGGSYAGYVRWETQLALAAVPPDVTLLIGAPACSTGGPWPFSSAETVARAIRGARLAISPVPPRRPFGIAPYVDFTATAQDWASYLTGWTGR